MTPQRHRYFDRSGRELSRAQALENGHLRDGVSLRVHMSARDSARAFWDANRDSLLVTDARAIGGTEGCKPGFRVSDSPINRQEIADARAQYLHDLQNAWRNPLRLGDAAPSPDPEEDEEDEDEDDDGRPQGRRVRPVTADAIANHQQNMARIYDQIASDLSQQWRRGK
jgi:hypothetical protein